MRTKAEITRDLAAAEEAKSQIPLLEATAAKAAGAATELQAWEERGGWSERERKAKLTAEAIGRELSEVQAEMLPLLRELEGTPLGQLIGCFYRFYQLRDNLRSACQHSIAASYEREITSRAEAKGSQLTKAEAAEAASFYGETAVLMFENEICPDRSPLARLPAGRPRILAAMVEHIAFPAARPPQPLDFKAR